MAADRSPARRRFIGRILSIVIIVAAVMTGLLVIYITNVHPRTDDAEVFANFIGIAPQVEGPITKLYVKDNQLVHKGDLLFEIDDVPYRYTLERAQSEQAALEGQIADQRKRIQSQSTAVRVAQASQERAQAGVISSVAAVDEAKADVAHAEQGVARAEAEWSYAQNNLHRIEPLLARQFVTVDQIDQARTTEATRAQAVKQARAQLALSEARLKSALAQVEQSRAGVQQSGAQFNQSVQSISLLAPLTAQREGRASAVKNAQYNLDRCRVYSPFEARVTNLTISEGAYAHIGQQIFTLIDARTWWVIANFRETQLRHIQPGMLADVYVMSKANTRFTGVVESISYGVTPDANVLGRLSSGLPDVQRSLNWVRLASRYPVRVRVEEPSAELFRIGESAVIVVRGEQATTPR
jgi:membrane fusion protein, multidrug efflux system